MTSPLSLLGQEQSDSLNIIEIVEDSLNVISSEIQHSKVSIQNIDNQIVGRDFSKKLDSVSSYDREQLTSYNKIADTLIHRTDIHKVLPKGSDLGSSIIFENQNILNHAQTHDVPNIPLSKLPDLNKIELEPIKVIPEKILKDKSTINSNLNLRQNLDSLTIEDIEKKAGTLAKDNIDELQELDRMEGAANNARSQMDDLKWDKSKINSSKNVAKVLSENVETVQAGMEKMKDLKGKYSKVNLLNPKGPVLKKISNKPSKPWQFSLNFSSKFQNGISIQIAPSLGYKLHERWVGGIGISYQMRIMDIDSSFTFLPNQELSHRIFNQFNFYRNFFLHLEHELPYKKPAENKEGSWYNLAPQKSRAWVGLALQYGLYKDIKGQTQILYNLIEPDFSNAPENRWTIRINLIF
ncbi:hypothetical protein [Marivirga tractuosa]|nr:hypothetical protein [Marivirga tractuosa]